MLAQIQVNGSLEPTNNLNQQKSFKISALPRLLREWLAIAAASETKRLLASA
jgi:hypothetical protein